jgi:large subunit ribosomal protein L4e
MARAARRAQGTVSRGSKARAGAGFRGGSRKVKARDLTGKAGAAVSLPAVFDTPVREDLIRKSVKVAQANRRQAYGPNPRSGMRHSVETWGKGRGTARVQRLKDGRDGAESPNNVGGRRAHPPRPEKDWSLKMNVKERRLARNSAISATANPAIVKSRGHLFPEGAEFPLVVDDQLQKVSRTKDIIAALDAIGLYDDLVRAEGGKHVRSGRGKRRGRRYRVPRSVLIVVSKEQGIERGGANLTGVDIVTTDRLSTEDLAPGGQPGRLTVYTESAIKRMGAW